MILVRTNKNYTSVKNSQNIKHMNKVKFILSFLLLNAFLAIGQTVTVLNKGDTIVAPDDLTVVMDKYTFGKYAYTVDKYDTLKHKIIEYDSIIQSRDSIQQEVIGEYKTLLDQKETEKEVYKSGYEDVKTTLQTSIDKNNQLQIDYKKLEHKNRRLKRWRNIFMGSSLCFGTVILLIVII